MFPKGCCRYFPHYLGTPISLVIPSGDVWIPVIKGCPALLVYAFCVLLSFVLFCFEWCVHHLVPSSLQIQWAWYKKWNGKPRLACRCLASTFENSCRCTALDMPEWREMAEQIDWRAKQSSQVAYFSEDLKCREAWDTTCGHKSKDITLPIDWRREAWKEEALDDLPWKGERAMVNQTIIGTISKATLGELLRNGIERIWAFPNASIPSWTELNRTSNSLWQNKSFLFCLVLFGFCHNK